MVGPLRSLLAIVALVLAGCATTAPRLEGPDWRLTAWSVSSMRATDHPITARFAGGGIQGRSAVNTYRGAATVGPGSAIAFGPFATTRMAGPEPAMRAEGLYLGLLERVRSYRIDADRLMLFDDNGNELLVFSRPPG